MKRKTAAVPTTRNSRQHGRPGFRQNDNQALTGIRDGSSAGVAGLAGPMIVYTSARRPDPVVFTALTGSNSLLIAVPAQLGLANSIFFIY